jgi:hypothetical protein
VRGGLQVNKTTLTLGGLIAALTPLAMWAYQSGVVTTAGIRYAMLIAGLSLLSLVISWGATEAYKRLFVLESWSSPTGKRRIYACALLTGAGAMLLCGVVFLVLVEFTWQTATLIGVMWTLVSIALGVSSPFVWKLAFELLLPRLKRCKST